MLKYSPDAKRNIHALHSPSPQPSPQGQGEASRVWRLEDDQVIPMDDFDAFQLARTDLGRIERRDASREFGAIKVANPHHVSGGELTLAAHYTGRQKAFAILAQRFFRTGIHEERAFRMMKESNPSFASLQARRLGHE